MKRKVYAWILAAAMAFTSTPGYALSAYAGETEAAVLTSDDSAEEEPAEGNTLITADPDSGESSAVLSDRKAGETAGTPADQDTGLFEDQGTDAVQAPDAITETETETETESELRRKQSPPADSGLLSGTEVSSETPADETVTPESSSEVPADETVVSEEDEAEESPEAVEEAPLTEADETSDQDGTGNIEIDPDGISSVVLIDRTGILYTDPAQDTQSIDTNSYLRATVTRMDGTSDRVDYLYSTSTTIGDKTVGVLYGYAGSDCIYIAAKDLATGMYADLTAGIPVGRTLTYIPYEKGTDPETSEFDPISITFPDIPESETLTLGEPKALGTDPAWYSFSQSAEAGGYHMLQFTADGDFSGSYARYTICEKDGYRYINTLSRSRGDGEDFREERLFLNAGDTLAVKVFDFSGQNIRVALRDPGKATSISLDTQSVSRLEIADDSFPVKVSAAAWFEDEQVSRPVSFNLNVYSSDGSAPKIYAFDSANNYYDLSLTDENGNSFTGLSDLKVGTWHMVVTAREGSDSDKAAVASAEGDLKVTLLPEEMKEADGSSAEVKAGENVYYDLHAVSGKRYKVQLTGHAEDGYAYPSLVLYHVSADGTAAKVDSDSMSLSTTESTHDLFFTADKAGSYILRLKNTEYYQKQVQVSASISETDTVSAVTLDTGALQTVFDSGSGSFLKTYRDSLKGKITMTSGDTWTLPGDSSWWGYTVIDGRSVSTMTARKGDSEVGVYARDKTTGEIINDFSWDRIPCSLSGKTIVLQPYETGAAQDTTLQGFDVTLPKLPAATEVPYDSQIDLSDGWYSFTLPDNADYMWTFTTDGSAYYNYRSLVSQGEYGASSYGSYYESISKDSTGYVSMSERSQGKTVYLYVDGLHGDKVQLSVTRKLPVTSLKLHDAEVSTADLAVRRYNNYGPGSDPWCRMAQVLTESILYQDLSPWTVNDSYGAQPSSEGLTAFNVRDQKGTQVEFRFVDEKGEPKPVDMAGRSSYDASTLPSGQYHIQAFYSEYDQENGKCKSYPSNIVTLTLSDYPDGVEDLEPGKDPVSVTLKPDEIRYFRLNADTAGNYNYYSDFSSGSSSLRDFAISRKEDGSWNLDTLSQGYSSSGEKRNQVTIDETGAAVVALRNIGGSTISGKIRFRSIEDELKEAIGKAEPIELGVPVKASWQAKDTAFRYYTYTADDDTDYRLSGLDSELGASIYDLEDYSQVKGESDWDTFEAGLKKGHEYMLCVAPKDQVSYDVSTLLVLEKKKDVASVLLELSGNGGKVPQFISGLKLDWGQFPIWRYGKLKVSLKAADGTLIKSEYLNSSDYYEDIYYRVEAVTGFDEEGNPEDRKNAWDTIDAAGNIYYALLAKEGYFYGESRYLPAEAVDGTFTPSLDKVSKVAFTVISKKEAAEQHPFESGAVTVDPDSTYYSGTLYKADKTGVVNFVSTEVIDKAVLYEAAGSGASEKKRSLVRLTGTSFQASVTEGHTYYLFVSPSDKKKFTVSVESPVTVKEASVNSRISTDGAEGIVSSDDFGVDLTYDDGTVLDLQDGEEDIYGNSFQYSLQGDDDYGIYFYDGRGYYTEGGMATGSFIRSGHYQLKAEALSRSFISTGGSYSAGRLTAGTDFTVAAPKETGSILGHETKKLSIGNSGLYTYVPAEDGMYSVLVNGVPQAFFLTKEKDGHLAPCEEDLPGIVSLKKGATYYVPVNAENSDVEFSVTERFPVQGTGTYTVSAKAGENAQLLLQVPDDRSYRLTVTSSDGSGTRIVLLDGNRRRYFYEDGDSYGRGNVSELTGYLYGGYADMLTIYPEGEYSAKGQTSYTVVIEKAAGPEPDDDTEENAPEITVSAPDIDYPWQFADSYDENQEAELIKVVETCDGKTAETAIGKASALTGRTYRISSIEPEISPYARIYIESRHLWHRDYVKFTGDISAAPELKTGVPSSKGLEKAGTWFYRFTPEQDGKYAIAVDKGTSVSICTTDRSWSSSYPDNVELEAGTEYYIACIPAEDTGKASVVSLKKMQKPVSVAITGHPSDALRAALGDRAGYTVKIGYEDGTEQVYDLGTTYEESNNYTIYLRGALIPYKKGDTRKARIRVTVGGKSASVDLPLKEVSTVPEIALTEDQAGAIPADGIKTTWYRFTPDVAGAYECATSLGDAAGKQVSIRVYDAESGKFLTLPRELEAGKTYLIGICAYSDKEVKAWLQPYENKESNTKTLTYVYVSKDEHVLPEELKAPDPVVCVRNTEIRITDPETVRYDMPDRSGTWVFKGYDKDIVRMDQDTTVTGTWVFAEEVHAVKYVFVSENGTRLPEEVMAVKPQDAENVIGGTSVTPEQPAQTSIKTADGSGLWKFAGYDKSSEVMGSSDITFTGTWKFGSLVTLTYQFAKAAADQERIFDMPAAPESVSVIAGDNMPEIAPVAKTVVNTEDGVWMFDGFDRKDLPEKMTTDLTVTGTWHFEKKVSGESAAQVISEAGSESADTIVGSLVKSDSSKVKEALDSQAKDELAKEGKETTDEAVIAKVADKTGRLDSSLEGKTVTLPGAGSAEGKTATIGATAPGSDSASGLAASIAGATPTAASAARDDAVNGRAEDSTQYRAAVKVVPKQMTPPDKTPEPGKATMRMDISMNVETVKNGKVIDEKKNVEPVSPITITLTLPANYRGYGFKLYHWVDGRKVRVPYEFVKNGTQIRFVVSSLSEFEADEFACLHEQKTLHQAVAATCTAAGSEAYSVCATCGTVFDEAGNAVKDSSVFTIPALGHDLHQVGAVPATCTAAGHGEYYTCSREPGKFFDAAGKQLSAVPSIPAAGHKWGSWTTTREATVTAEGLQTRVCANDRSHTETRKVAKLAAVLTLRSGQAVVTGTLPMKTKQKFRKLTADMNKGDSIASVKSSKTKVATVSISGTAITVKAGKKTGTAAITVTTAGGAVKTFKVKVGKKKVTAKKAVNFPKKLTLKAGEKKELGTYITPVTVTDKMKFTSSKKKVAAVSKNGTITAKKKGTATITLKVGKKKFKCKVTVK